MTEPWMLHDMEDATVVTVKKPGKFIALCDGKSFTDEENANHARLIVTAVNCHADLLAALEAMLKTHGFTSSCPACKQARTAILKARGPQATSPYLNKPLRSLEQAVRDGEGQL